jgi:hypothetical protein
MLPQGPLFALPFLQGRLPGGWLGAVILWSILASYSMAANPLELGTLVCEHFSTAAKFGKHVLHERIWSEVCCASYNAALLTLCCFVLPSLSSGIVCVLGV